MANQFGYNQQFADAPGMWDIDGYAKVTDGYGNLSVFINRVSTTGVLTSVQQLAPSSAIADITQTANSSGIYKIHLNQTWVQLHACEVETVIPSTLSPAILLVQHNKDTVGNTSFGPGLAELQYVQFTTVVPSTGSVGVLPLGSGLRFRLRLQNVST